MANLPRRLGAHALLGMMTLLPLAYWTPFHDCFPLAKWLVLLTLGVVAVGLGQPGSFSPAFRWFPVWAIWVVASACRGEAADSPWRAWPETALLILPVWVAASARHGVSARRAAGMLLVTSTVIAALGLAQAAGWDLGTWISPFHKGVASTIGNPDLLGGFLVLPFALALAGWRHACSVTRRDRIAAQPVWWWTFALVILGCGLLATEARGAWLAALAASAVLLWGAPRRIVGLVAGACVVAAVVVSIRNPGMLDNLRSLTAMHERAWTWKIAGQAIREAPLAGWGAGSFRSVYLKLQTATRDQGEEYFHYTEYAHLELLHLWTELGIIGLGLWLWGVAAAFAWWRASDQRTGDPALWRGLGAGGLGVMVNSFASFPIHILPTIVPLWVLLGLSGMAGRPESLGRKIRPGVWASLGRLAVVALLLAIPFRFAFVSAALHDGQALAHAGRHLDAGRRYAAGMRLAEGEVRLPWFAAVAARELGDLESALAWVERSLVLEPEFYELRYLHGMICKALGRVRDAETAYRRALRIHPRYALAWNNLGNLLGARGRLAAAEVAQRRALALHPALSEARQNLAVTLQMLGRPQEARRILEGGAP